MKKVEDLKVKIFADGADKENMLEMYAQPHIKGLTTNPTLMKKAGISNYEKFCKEIISLIKDKPISFEVFADDITEMESQAMEIASWGENVYVKIPITNTKGISTLSLIKKISTQGVKVNVTAIMTLMQVREVIDSLNHKVPSYISVFAGRIADTGRDPIPIMTAAIEIIKLKPMSELIWASPRELLNIIQADHIGCHVITATTDILRKINLIGYDLKDYSLDTVKMFHKDAINAGFKIKS